MTSNTDDLVYLFIDLEGTGLNFQTDLITEVCAVGTTRDYRKIFEINEVIHVPADFQWDPYAKQMAIDNGLYEETKTATLTIEMVENRILDMLQAHGNPKKITLSGSGVANYDKPMMFPRMPRLSAHFNYFTHDIGESRRAYSSANGVVFTKIDKSKTHRAADDIECHLAEARAHLHLNRYIHEHLRTKAAELGIDFDTTEPYQVLKAIAPEFAAA